MDPILPFRLLQGEVADDPTEIDELIRIAVPRLEEVDTVIYGPMDFRINVDEDGNPQFPARGDRALICILVEGDPWLISWAE